ncbi:MAG: hypothetical protein ACTSW1_14720 [Candidatus Hodarchaeales archaeon]
MISINETFNRIRAKILQIKAPVDYKNWQEQLISLYFIRTTDGICLYSHYFQLGSLSHIENQLVGMGFTALYRMLKEIVGSKAQLKTIDLGTKQVLIESRNNLMSILIASNDSPIIRSKLSKLTLIFEQMFELQRQINSLGYVRQEDYEFTSQLISLIFSNQYHNILDLIPLLFKLITYNGLNSDSIDEEQPNNKNTSTNRRINNFSLNLLK